MSKYRIGFKTSTYWWLFQATVLTALLLSVWCWKAHLFIGQIWIQLAISAMMVVLVWRYGENPLNGKWIMLSDMGEWLWLDSQQAAQLTARSRVSGWLLWLHLQHSDGSSRWCWVFRDSVSEQDYRRLARVVINVQQQGIGS